MKGENEIVRLQVLRKHPEYIRGTIKADYVSELVEVFNVNGRKWFGGEAMLQPIPADHVERKEGGEYWIIDGHNRAAAAVEAGLKEIPAIVFSGLTDGEAVALQIKSAINRGLRLTPAQQTAAILKMSALGMKQAEIAEKAGLHQSSISRIVREKQRADAGKSTTEAGGSAAGKTGKTAKPFDKEKAELWFKGLSRLLKSWKVNGSKIRKYGAKMEVPESCYKSLDNLLDNLLEKETEE